jgi:ribosomal protein S18 acetylase RimI-like enzyme
VTGVLEQVPSLAPAARAALTALERDTVAADGGRLKLEWAALDEQSGDVVHDLLWWQDDRLVGFLGLYDFASPVELAGMVHPDARRRGIGTTMLDAALRICRERGQREALLVTPRNAAGGREFALARGGVLDHSEHALTLRHEPAAGVTNPAVTVRRATADDADDVCRFLEAAFGRQPPSDLRERLGTEGETMLLIGLDGVAVGTVRLTRDGTTGRVYGFAIDPPWQGRGIGRDVLRRICRQLRAEGAQQVGLEVEVDNERALGLYTSVGFEPVMTEDYYRLLP